MHGLLFDGTLMPSALMPDLPASGEDSDPSEAPASPSTLPSVLDAVA